VAIEKVLASGVRIAGHNETVGCVCHRCSLAWANAGFFAQQGLYLREDIPAIIHKPCTSHSISRAPDSAERNWEDCSEVNSKTLARGFQVGIFAL
jgi:hypothetical protein